MNDFKINGYKLYSNVLRLGDVFLGVIDDNFVRFSIYNWMVLLGSLNC